MTPREPVGFAPVAHVAVCIATYQRPVGIDRLLASVRSLTVPTGVSLSVVVCDNDPARSAVDRFEATPPVMDAPLFVVHQPERGVASVRNALVAKALEIGADAIAFVDDDEIVPVDWIGQLVKIQHRDRAAIVSGPVQPIFEVHPPSWLVELGYFDAIDYPDGTDMVFGNSNNVLVHADVLASMQAPFDVRLNLTGGEDTHFFQRCLMAGHIIKWTTNAQPSEFVPESKMSPRWIRRREYRRGTTRSFVLLDLEDSWPRRAKRVVASAVEFARGTAQLARSPFAASGSARAARRLRGVNHLAYGAGMVAGLFGASYREYETTHGS
jgi:succinoglycan biosynthesis protein ExoM